MIRLEDLRISRSLKYTALYWKLGFVEVEHDVFEKEYRNNQKIIIYADKQQIDLGKISVINKEFTLKDHKSFVILECINKLLEMGYSPLQIVIDTDNEYDIYCGDLYIKCHEWGRVKQPEECVGKPFYSVDYSSRLVSGLIERDYIISKGKNIYNKGAFLDKKIEEKDLINSENKNAFNITEIKGSKFVRYKGKEKVIKIPDYIDEIESSAFWDNQYIEEVILPEGLKLLGGDCFYNCSKLKKITIPSTLTTMGNNPFAGCPKLKLKNKSKHFVFSKGVLYDKNKKETIYYELSNKQECLELPNTVTFIGKHTFYLAKNLKKIVIPESVIKMENCPFSGCDNLELENHSKRYLVKDGVIYTADKKVLVGVLPKTKTDNLVIENVEVISRNSCWNCKGIKKITLPETLEEIGYNPFVGCENIEFESKSPNYIVEDGVLYTKDKTKIVCWPSKFSKETIAIPDGVEILERGALSGLSTVKTIYLNQVKMINKNCFTNCELLERVYSEEDTLHYIGEYAFNHCVNLKYVELLGAPLVEKNAFINTKHLIVKGNYHQVG